MNLPPLPLPPPRTVHSAKTPPKLVLEKSEKSDLPYVVVIVLCLLILIPLVSVFGFALGRSMCG
jgi:hypothetical protein